MLRSVAEACRLYPENGAEFCRGNDNRRFGEMFQVAGDNFRAIFGEGGTVEHLVLWVCNWGVGFGWRYPDGVSHDKFQKCIYVCLVKGKLLSHEDFSVFFDNATGNNGCERTIDQCAKGGVSLPKLQNADTRTLVSITAEIIGRPFRDEMPQSQRRSLP